MEYKEGVWYDYKKNPPELGEEVIAYSSKWIEKIGNRIEKSNKNWNY